MIASISGGKSLNTVKPFPCAKMINRTTQGHRLGPWSANSKELILHLGLVGIEWNSGLTVFDRGSTGGQSVDIFQILDIAQDNSVALFMS